MIICSVRDKAIPNGSKIYKSNNYFYFAGLKTMVNPMVDEVDLKEDYSIYDKDLFSIIFTISLCLDFGGVT